MEGAWKLPLHSNNKQKAEQAEKLTTLLRSVREVWEQGISLPPNLERLTDGYGESQLTRAAIHS